MTKPCEAFDLYLDLPRTADVTTQSAVVFEHVRAHQIGAPPRDWRVWVTGAAARLRGLTPLGVRVVTPERGTTQPHQVRLTESDVDDDDARPLATCVACGAVGRYAGAPEGTRGAWNRMGLQVMKYTVADPTRVRIADTDIQWEEPCGTSVH